MSRGFLAFFAAMVLGGCSAPTEPAEPSQPMGVLLVSEARSGKMYLFNVRDTARTIVRVAGGRLVPSFSTILTHAADALIGFGYEAGATRIFQLGVSDLSIREVRSFPEPITVAIGSLHPDGARVSILLADHVSTSRAAVHELDLATGATTPLLTLPEDEWVGYVVWLPSGQEYVMSVYRPSTQITELRRFSRSSPTSTGTPIPGTQCANLADPTVSPDGRQIVFLCGNTYRSVGLDGARPAPLPPGFRSLGPVKFSPDGEFLAYTSYEDSQIWFLRLSTGEHWRAFDTDDIALLSDWR